MRQLKFRFWDSKSKKFEDEFYISKGGVFDIYKDYGGMFTSDLVLEKKDVIIQQFTGLKDVNGVDIYEGDIVEYTQHMFNTDAVRTERKEIKWIEYSAKFNVYETEAGQSGHKVVGNIFEDNNG